MRRNLPTATAGSHQLAWRTHSITLSARSKSEVGRSRPSVLCHQVHASLSHEISPGDKYLRVHANDGDELVEPAAPWSHRDLREFRRTDQSNRARDVSVS